MIPYEIVIFPVLRSVSGWLENSISDGKLTALELRKLAETVLRVGMMAAAAYYSIPFEDEASGALASGAIAFVLDKARTTFKKR